MGDGKCGTGAGGPGMPLFLASGVSLSEIVGNQLTAADGGLGGDEGLPTAGSRGASGGIYDADGNYNDISIGCANTISTGLSGL